MPRALLLVVLAGVIVGTLAGPAAAHGSSSESTNFRSAVTQAPDIEGITWGVLGGDQYLTVENDTDAEILVQGYDGEPYARIGPEGVFLNLASKATYLNADRFAEVTLPENVGRGQEPRWDKVSAEPTYAWHDHRVHWMSAQLPPAVTDQGKSALIPMGPEGTNEWIVPFGHDGQDHEVRGELRWVPPPSPYVWLAIGLVVTLPALVGLRRGVGRDRVRRLITPAAVVLGVVGLLNITHLVDILALPLPATTKLVSALQTALFIALGLFGAGVARRGRDGAFTALGVGAGGILAGQGLLYLAVLQASQSASVFPDWSARTIVALQ